MEVSGQKHSKQTDVKLCSFCEDFDISTSADGYCVECEVFFCNKCFVKHKGRKISRDHSLVKVWEAQSSKLTVIDTFEACQHHRGKHVDLYCPNHGQVCCGECVVLHHNGCKLELVRDKAVAFQNSNNLNELSKGMKEITKQAQDSASLVESNKQLLSDLYEQFVRDVDVFVDEIIEHINTMKTIILDKGKDIMLKDTQRMDELNKEIDEIIAEISQQNDQLESKRDQPNKLFVASISVKTEVTKSQQHLDLLNQRNAVTHYTFKRDQTLENILKEKKVIGVLLEQLEIGKPKHNDVKQTEIAEESNEQHTPLDDSSKLNMYTVPRGDNLDVSDNRSKQTLNADKHTTVTRQTKENTMSVSQQKCQPLIQSQLYCKDINIDGQILSYAASEKRGVGLYVSNEELSEVKTFEIEILSLGRKGSIAIGTVPIYYQGNLLPGLQSCSYGYHSDGKVYYNGHDQGIERQKWTKGDSIRCTIKKKFNIGLTFSFTHNGREVNSYSVPWGYHFAVGMKSEGDKVKVIV